MLCDKCKKNPAVIHIKEFINGKCNNLNLCPECAAKNNAAMLPGIGLSISDLIMQHPHIAEQFASGKSGHAENKDNDGNLESALLRCPACSWSLSDFESHDHKFGCPQCSKTFRKVLLRDRSAAELTHLGKRPHHADKNSPVAFKNRIFTLKKKLQRAVAAEDYESAAICRDQIAELQAQNEMLQRAGK